MRLTSPRIEPLTHDQLNAEQARVLGGSATATVYPLESLAQHKHDHAAKTERPLFNAMRTLARIPEAYRWLDQWGTYVLSAADGLNLRERQIVLLRTVFLCKAGYAWGLHSLLTQKASALTEDEILRIKSGSGAGWNSADTVLIRAIDELHADKFIIDSTWNDLRKHFSEEQAMGVVFTAGQYTLVSMVLNTFGVQLDEGLAEDPELRA